MRLRQEALQLGVAAGCLVPAEVELDMWTAEKRADLLVALVDERLPIVD